MPSARDIPGAVFRNGTATLLARIVTTDGVPITQSAVAAIRYTVSRLHQADPDDLAPIAGHVDGALDPSDVVFDTLQTGGAWTADATGYNFRHEVDAATTEPFPEAGRCYQVRYELTPIVGQKIVFRFKLRSL